MKTDNLKEFKDYRQKLDGFKINLIEAAKLLASISKEARPALSAIKHWGQLIEDWVADESLPLYIRKSGSYNRGHEITHSSRRILIPADNGPAHWSFSMCVNENLISLSEISELIKEDQIPIAYALKASEASGTYKQTKHLIDTPNKKGWKIAHIVPVGLKSRKRLEDMDIEELKDHFRKFMSPSNMFLIPLEYSGLAEIDEVIDVYKQSWF